MAAPRTVIEASWEVANKVGGIYTVVSGHAKLLDDHYDDYFCVGPLRAEQDFDFFEEPAPERIRQVLEKLRSQGVNGVYGRWDIPGRPATVLLDARHAHFDTDAIKKELWERYEIDSIDSGWEFEEPLRWSWAVGLFVQQLRERSEGRVVAHLHEWMSGFAGLYLKARGVDAGVVFTTHATMLGRTISANTDIDLYGELESLDARALADEFNITAKFTTEVACAREADVFTTVSDITAREAAHLLGTQPHVITYNGISSEDYPTLEEASVLHARNREQIRDFLNYYFFSHYTFDLEESLIFFTSGRFEYKNKGLDVLTDALGRLNAWMQEVDHRKTVVVFYWIPGETHGIKTEVLEERGAFSNMQQFVEDRGKQIVRRILRNAHDLEDLRCSDLLDEEQLKQLRRMSKSLDHGGTPPLCTHNIPFEEDDAVIRALRANGLDNAEHDKVKAIRYPVYLEGSDGLLDLSYNEAIAGTHLGLFPSYYEPWGYTPVEAAGYAIPSVTTDLGGFGRYVQDEDSERGGVYVLGREGRSYEDIVQQLFETMQSYVNLDKHGRMEQKLAAKHLSKATEWQTFIKRYFQAHTQAYETHE